GGPTGARTCLAGGTEARDRTDSGSRLGVRAGARLARCPSASGLRATGEATDDRNGLGLSERGWRCQRRGGVAVAAGGKPQRQQKKQHSKNGESAVEAQTAGRCLSI